MNFSSEISSFFDGLQNTCRIIIYSLCHPSLNVITSLILIIIPVITIAKEFELLISYQPINKVDSNQNIIYYKINII